jgi:hypothetical protein
MNEFGWSAGKLFPLKPGYRFPTPFIKRFFSINRYKQFTSSPSLRNKGQELKTCMCITQAILVLRYYHDVTHILFILWHSYASVTYILRFFKDA